MATIRLINAGVFDRHPGLIVQMSHLSGGIASMIARIRSYQDKVFWGTKGNPRHGALPAKDFDYYINHNMIFDSGGFCGAIEAVQTALVEISADRIVFGTDYPTPDGTCVRDYVHVADLAAAHVLGLRRLLDGKGGGTYCLGTGRGFSVREVIEASRGVTNREVPVILGERRPGDAASLVMSSCRAISELGWEPQHSSLRKMIGDAWAWAQKPGFGG